KSGGPGAPPGAQGTDGPRRRDAQGLPATVALQPGELQSGTEVGIWRAERFAFEGSAGLGGQGTIHQVLGLSGGRLGAAVFQGLVWLGEPEPAQAGGGSGADAQAPPGKFVDVSEASHHQRGDRRIELENPEHQIQRAGLPQLSQLPDSHPVLLRKAQSLPTINREEPFPVVIGQLKAIITADTLALHLAIAHRVHSVSFFAPTSAAEINTFGRGLKVISGAPDYCNY